MSEYGSEGFRVRLRRLPEYGFVACLVERSTLETRGKTALGHCQELYTRKSLTNFCRLARPTYKLFRGDFEGGSKRAIFGMCWKGPKGMPVKGVGENTKWVNQGMEVLSGCFQGVFPYPFAGSFWTLPNIVYCFSRPSLPFLVFLGRDDFLVFVPVRDGPNATITIIFQEWLQQTKRKKVRFANFPRVCEPHFLRFGSPELLLSFPK